MGSTTVNQTTWWIKYNDSADISFGLISCLCFFIGTFGNFVSFLYFKSKKRDISNAIYMIITANDIVISLAILPAAIPYLSQRPSILFSYKYGCVPWYYIWKIAIPLSVFLVLCLSVARTISLIKPFLKQRIRYLIIAVTVYVVLMFMNIAIMHSLNYTTVKFEGSKCDLYIDSRITDTSQERSLQATLLIYNVVYIAPAFVVATSCGISAAVLRRKNKNVQQRELQQSRNRATVTILLFALLYGICNAPMILHFLILTYCVTTDNYMFYVDFYYFDTQGYYRNVVVVLLSAVNSAANPLLYFWRMKPLREYTMKGIRKVFNLKTHQRGTIASNVRGSRTLDETVT